MAFCKACGTELGGAAFCPKCGASQTASAVPWAQRPAASSEGLAENVAGLLCYVLGWLTGIIFILIDKRPFVRFHAAQSIVVFGALTVLRIGYRDHHGHWRLRWFWFLGVDLYGIRVIDGNFVDSLNDQGLSARTIPRAHCGADRRWNRRKIINPYPKTTAGVALFMRDSFLF